MKLTVRFYLQRRPDECEQGGSERDHSITTQRHVHGHELTTNCPLWTQFTKAQRRLYPPQEPHDVHVLYLSPVESCGK